jgi:hypothetical protein
MERTANGLPYPVGTDLVRDGDNAIRALAEAIDGNWVGGQFDAATDGSGQFRIPTARQPRTIVPVSRITATRLEFVVSGFDGGGAVILARDLATGAAYANQAVGGYYMALLKIN